MERCYPYKCVGRAGYPDQGEPDPIEEDLAEVSWRLGFRPKASL